MATLLLIDGHSQAYRAYFGMKTPLSTRYGEPTAAVYGFVRKLFSVLREYKPEYVAVAFDTGDTWRHAEFPDYKATRDSMPDDMRTQMVRIEEVLRAFNIPIITYPNFEADDILGTLSRQAAEDEFDVLVMTGDRDMFQLVSDRVKILYTSGGPNPVTSIYGKAEVKERYQTHTGPVHRFQGPHRGYLGQHSRRAGCRRKDRRQIPADLRHAGRTLRASRRDQRA